MILLATVAAGAYWLDHKNALQPQSPQAVTVAAPPLLYSPELRYEEDPLAPPPTPPATVTKLKQKVDRLPGTPAKVAIIIDDVGLSRAHTLPVIDLPAPIALAFLPYGEHVANLAAQAHTAGHTVLLHMPMQPQGREDPGPNALLVGLDAASVVARIDAALARVPHVMGVNNHMGSAATADWPLMQALMATLKQRNLFFVDSYTSAASVAFKAAQGAGLRTAQRNVFLDNDPSKAAIIQQLQRLEQIAQQQGHAIAIGHPYPSTIAALREWLGGLDSRGIKLVSITELLGT